MSATSIETGISDGATVTAEEALAVDFVLKLAAVAKASRPLLETVERLGLGDDLLDVTRAARTAFDRLDVVQARATS